MEPRPYQELSPVELLTLCCWREARGESLNAKIAQCWAVKNRVEKPGWWGHDWHTVILKPWQFSSFNKNDPNSEKWPEDDDPAFEQCVQAAEAVMLGTVEDPTNGSTHYYDTSIEFPRAWGNESEWENTLNIDHFRFWRLKPTTDLGV